MKYFHIGTTKTLRLRKWGYVRLLMFSSKPNEMKNDVLPNNAKETCLSCKITSICCLSGIGSYFIYHSRQATQKHKTSLLILGTGCIILGIGEIFDKSPFRSHHKADHDVKVK